MFSLAGALGDGRLRSATGAWSRSAAMMLGNGSIKQAAARPGARTRPLAATSPPVPGYLASNRLARRCDMTLFVAQ